MDEKLQSHFLNLFNFALSDTQVDVKEAERLYEIAIQRGIDKADLDYVLDNPHKVKTHLPTEIDEIVDQLIDISKIILADGKIDIREIQALKDFLKITLNESPLIEDIIESVIDSVKAKLDEDQIKTDLISIINRG